VHSSSDDRQSGHARPRRLPAWLAVFQSCTRETACSLKAPARPFAALLEWIESQFEALGKRKEKRALALHLLSALQGVSLLANNFNDPDRVILEGDLLKAWIGELEATAVSEGVG
jgi:hypothetical protein